MKNLLQANSLYAPKQVSNITY